MIYNSDVRYFQQCIELGFTASYILMSRQRRNTRFIDLCVAGHHAQVVPGAGLAGERGVRPVRGEVPRLERVPHHLPVAREQGLRVSLRSSTNSAHSACTCLAGMYSKCHL